MNNHDITHIHSILSQLTSAQRKRLVKSIRERGIPLREIQPYTYAETPGIKHVFLYFEGEKKPTPYFLVEKEIWEEICRIILSQTI